MFSLSQALVIRTKSTESMSLPFSLMSTMATSLWTLYGIIIADFYVQVRAAMYGTIVKKIHVYHCNMDFIYHHMAWLPGGFCNTTL